MGNLAKFGIGCGVIVIAAIVAVVILVPKGWKYLADQIAASGEAGALAGEFVPPSDNQWTEKDWPGSLEGGWGIVPADQQLMSTKELIDEDWASRMYQISDEQDGEEKNFLVTIHLRPADADTQAQIKEDLEFFEIPNQDEEASFTMGPRSSRTLGSGDMTRTYELWTMGKDEDWLMMVEGEDETKVKDGAIQFLESLKTDAGYIRR